VSIPSGSFWNPSRPDLADGGSRGKVRALD